MKLKPCPFCGGEVRITNVFGRVGVICLDCPAEMRGWLDATHEEITEAWNRREPMEKVVEQFKNKARSGSVIESPNVLRTSMFVQINDAIEIVKKGGAV